MLDNVDGHHHASRCDRALADHEVAYVGNRKYHDVAIILPMGDEFVLMNNNRRVIGVYRWSDAFADAIRNVKQETYQPKKLSLSDLGL